jgi:cell division cycle protein 37
MVDYSKWNNLKVVDDDEDIEEIESKGKLSKEELELEKEKRNYEIRTISHNKKLAEIEAKKKMGMDVRRMEEEWNREDKSLAKAKRELYQKLKPPTGKARAAPAQPQPQLRPKEQEKELDPNPVKNVKDMSQDERLAIAQFIEKFQPILLDYGRRQGHEDTKQFLVDHPELVSVETTHFFGAWCLELALKGKLDMFNIVSHHAITLQCLLEYARQTNRDPKKCIDEFFGKLTQVNNPEYQKIFDDQIIGFRTRVKKQAEQNLLALPEEEQRGLVMSTIPDLLKESIEDEDEEMFREALQEVSKEDARYHLNRCIAARLWTPKNKKNLI